MPFSKNKPYPTWEPTQINIIPAIPDWSRESVNFEISFQTGTKVCEVNKRKWGKPNIPCGDYTIHITSESLNWNVHRYTDKALFTLLMLPNLQKMTSHQQDNFIDSIRQIYNYTIEENLVNYINSLKLNEELGIVLYTLWHRAIIEDRSYHPSYFSGHKQVLGVAIALIRKLQGVTFQGSDDISHSPYKMPLSVYVRNCTYWFDSL